MTMSVDDRFQNLFRDRDAARALLETAQRTLQHGGGDGTSGGGMEERVIRLEGDVARLKDDVGQMRADVGSLKTDVATLKENVRHLPTKPWLFTTLVALLGALGGIVALIVRFVPHAS
jgi:hypothetical protein